MRRILKTGDIISYRLEYLRKGGDFVTIDSLSRRRLVKCLIFCLRVIFFICARLSKVCNGVRTITLLRLPPKSDVISFKII